jgi:hypothetical protein
MEDNVASCIGTNLGIRLTNKLLSDLDQNWSKLSNSIEDEDRRVKDTLKTLLEQTDQTNVL